MSTEMIAPESVIKAIMSTLSNDVCKALDAKMLDISETDEDETVNNMLAIYFLASCLQDQPLKEMHDELKKYIIRNLAKRVIEKHIPGILEKYKLVKTPEEQMQ